MPRSILARCAPPAPGPADAKKSSQKRKIVKHKRYFEDVFEIKLPLPPAPSRAFEINPAAQTMVSNFPSSVPLLAQSQTTTETTSSDTVVTGTLDPAQARAKTTKGSKCTPSPTTTMAPTASEFFPYLAEHLLFKWCSVDFVCLQEQGRSSKPRHPRRSWTCFYERDVTVCLVQRAELCANWHKIVFSKGDFFHRRILSISGYCHDPEYQLWPSRARSWC